MFFLNAVTKDIINEQTFDYAPFVVIISGDHATIFEYQKSETD